MDGYATAKQLCGFYKISRSTVYEITKEMLQNPESRVLKIGRATRIPIQEFDDYLFQRMNRQKGESGEAGNDI